MTIFASNVRGPRDSAELFRRAPLLCGDHAVVNGPLKTVDRLALVDQIEDLRAEHRVAEIVAEVEGAEQPPQCVAGIVEGIASSGRTKAVERRARGIPAVLDRGAEPKQSLPTPADRPAGNGFGNDGPQDMRDIQ